MARYAIGDIQGCMATLERLLATIAFAPARDELWLVGDLVNRGPRSLDVLRWARALGDRATVVLGNHDLHLLARAAGVGKAKKRDTLDEILAAPDRDELIDWLRARPLCHVADGFVMVHAGVHPSWSLAQVQGYAREVEACLRGADWRTWIAQTLGPAPTWRPDRAGAERVRAILGYLVRVRMCRPDGDALPDFDGAPDEAPLGAVPWYRLTPAALARHTAVFGHWAAHGAMIGDDVIATDSACVWGGALTAVRLDDRAMFSVPALEPPAG
ncbi:MAG: symmetrical bis(5'-nucleosyl)-tetraphosphatase [Myxococcales bacterium]|nr:symmetrical bis(5'-nucleosyl)-tetraphosphatase [Myxococcales bacterium]